MIRTGGRGNGDPSVFYGDLIKSAVGGGDGKNLILQQADFAEESTAAVDFSLRGCIRGPE